MRIVPKEIAHMENDINRLDNVLAVDEQTIAALKEEVVALKDTLIELHEPASMSIVATSRPQKCAGEWSLNSCKERLKQMASYAFKLYEVLENNNNACYVNEPTNSCAVAGHIEAFRFRKFIRRYLHGYVLDIGCGPQKIPAYLDGYDLSKIYGLDPLVPHEPYPFEFEQGIAEFIPWGDGSFNCVLLATSLDHVLLPDKVRSEVKRVLAENGYLLIWTSLDENADEYDPYSKDVKPHDTYHMFHYRKTSFETDMSDAFEKIEYFRSDNNNHFYAYKRKS